MQFNESTNKLPTSIVLASDHNGVALKDKIKVYLKTELDIPVVIDLGPYTDEVKVDYPDYAKQLGTIVSTKEAERGILICGTGTGMSIQVNRIPKIRAVLAHSVEVAKLSREHNDTNVLCLGAWITPETKLVEQIVTEWLQTPWGQGRHQKRLGKLDDGVTSGVVLTNGVFDILHNGHLELLKFAKAQGKKLVVAIDSDKRVKELKGNDRPLNTETDRKAVLDALECVDEVLVFNSFEELQQIYQDLAPNVVVKGGEWTSEQVRIRDKIPGPIDIKIYPLKKDYSTTNLFKKIKEEMTTWMKQ